MHTIVQVLPHTIYVLNTENVLFYLKRRLLCTFDKYMYNYLCTAALLNWIFMNLKTYVYDDMPITKILLRVSNINVELSILYPGFHIKVLGVYTRSMETIYLSPEGTGSCGYLFHEIIPGISNEKCMKIICNIWKYLYNVFLNKINIIILLIS